MLLAVAPLAACVQERSFSAPVIGPCGVASESLRFRIVQEGPGSVMAEAFAADGEFFSGRVIQSRTEASDFQTRTRPIRPGERRCPPGRWCVEPEPVVDTISS